LPLPPPTTQPRQFLRWSSGRLPVSHPPIAIQSVAQHLLALVVAAFSWLAPAPSSNSVPTVGTPVCVDLGQNQAGVCYGTNSP
jgi:hypothetical protein